MIKDFHPTPDLREFERTHNVKIDGQTMILHLGAIDYGTHTGVVFKLCLASDASEIAMLPFEAHWHKRGRYLLQTGPVTAKGDAAIADAIAEIAGSCIGSAITAAQAKAQSRADMYDALEASADFVLDAMAGAIALGNQSPS
ncbi:MAG: hypothetical protein NWT00_00140 [Beijerinckiaceae bacterium]|jgi:hypothetical protein|nr:hypothetical protein [Beijerinckiaceae bacterium]